MKVSISVSVVYSVYSVVYSVKRFYDDKFSDTSLSHTPWWSRFIPRSSVLSVGFVEMYVLGRGWMFGG